MLKGYGSKVLMLVHISPSEEDVCETICSLNFAKRARAIESNKEVPVVIFLIFFSSKFLSRQCLKIADCMHTL